MYVTFCFLSTETASCRRPVLNVLFARALQLHVPSSPVITVNSVNPGLCFSGLGSGAPPEKAERMRQKREEFAFTTEEGSRQLVYGAVGSLDDEQKLRGKYIQMSEVVEESDFVISEDGKIVQDKVWVSSSLMSRLWGIHYFTFRRRCWRFSVTLIPRFLR